MKGLREIEEEEETIVALVVFKEDKQCCRLSLCVYLWRVVVPTAYFNFHTWMQNRLNGGYDEKKSLKSVFFILSNIFFLIT